MDHRIYVKHVNPDTLEICSEDDPEAVAFDRVSSKETPLGRVNRLVAALNCAIALTPDQRLVSLGTRLEVREANGQYHDPTLDAVAEFHKAFNAVVATEPGVGSYGPIAHQRLVAAQAIMDVLGRDLQIHASEVLEYQDEAGGLALIRLQLIQEELAELAEAIINKDIVEVLDALTDLDYVIAGTYHSFGLGHYKLAALAEVHSSNMSKLGEDGEPVIADSGRVMKGPNYRRPDLASVLGLPRKPLIEDPEGRN